MAGRPLPGRALAGPRRRSEPAVDRFTGDDRIVADYVRDEFLSTLAPDDLDFLTRSSILDELSGEVCDSVLEVEGSAERVVRLANSNLLLVPLDRRNESFRCHQLLREMLHGELRKRGAQAEHELHSRASDWFMQSRRPGSRDNPRHRCR